MNRLDLNSDLGESFGTWTLGMDQELLPVLTSANVACGWHGGDAGVMRQTVRRAAALKVGIGAHPGFPDLLGFGRREMKVTPQEAADYVTYQLGALAAFARAEGVELQHLKPHGALYNMACKDPELAGAIVGAARAFSRELLVLAPQKSCFYDAAAALGQPFAAEFFADRAYEPDGALVARSKPGAVITDPDVCCARVLRMAREGVVACRDGSVIPMECASVCVHGDNVHALEAARAIRRTLEENGVELRRMGDRA